MTEVPCVLVEVSSHAPVRGHPCEVVFTLQKK